MKSQIELKQAFLVKNHLFLFHNDEFELPYFAMILELGGYHKKFPRRSYFTAILGTDDLGSSARRDQPADEKYV